jgi:hypothetical protein
MFSGPLYNVLLKLWWEFIKIGILEPLLRTMEPSCNLAYST